MKTIAWLTTAVICCLLAAPAGAQKPLAFQATVLFPSFGLPLHQPAQNFRNLGFRAGVLVPFNQQQTTGLHLEAGFFRTRTQGQHLFAQARLAWHPLIAGKVEAGGHIGLGYQLAFGPDQGYIHDPENGWSVITNRKGMLGVVAGLHLGYRTRLSPGLEWRPFVDLDGMALVGYSEGYPVIPGSLISVGQMFKF